MAGAQEGRRDAVATSVEQQTDLPSWSLKRRLSDKEARGSTPSGTARTAATVGGRRPPLPRFLYFNQLQAAPPPRSHGNDADFALL